MLTVSGRLLKVQSRNLPAARNFSSGLRAIFMQSTPGRAAPESEGGPLAPFGPKWQFFRSRAAPSLRDSPRTRSTTRKRSDQACEEEPGGDPPERGRSLRHRGETAQLLGRRAAPLPPLPVHLP